MAEDDTSAQYFWIDPKANIEKTYADLLADISAIKFAHKCLKNSNTYQLYVELLAGMQINEEFILIDSDWSMNELQTLGIDEKQLSETVSLPHSSLSSFDEFLAKIAATKHWKLGFFTSGTTGRPKYIKHDLHVLARNVKTGARFSKNQWGFCYNPTHFAGIQVFLQAIFNKNTMVNMFHNDYALAERSLKHYAITHLSATPTYYRSIYPQLYGTYPLVERITFGGEMFDDQIAKMLLSYFPNARITNVYASTELGSILAGKGNSLKIPEEFSDRIRISDENELQVHKSLMGESESDEWFNTGDLVERKEDGTLQFVSRKSEMINVGGYKVNPHEIEEIIIQLPEVNDVVIYGRDNRITGKLIVADVKLSGISSGDMETKIMEHLKSRVQPWKIPRIIHIVDDIDRTRTGKKVRK